MRSRSARILLLFLSDGVNGVLGVATLSILARCFSTVEMANYLQAFLIFNTCLPLASVGLPDTLYSLIPKNLNRLGTLLLQTNVVLFLLGVLSVVGIFAVFSEFFSITDQRFDLKPIVETLSFSLVFSLPMLSIAPTLISLKDSSGLAWFLLTGRLLVFLSTAGMALFFRNPVSAVFGFGVANFIAYSFGVFILLRSPKLQNRRVDWQVADLRSQVALGLPLFLSAAFGGIQSQLDRWVISVMGTLEEFGRYAMVMSLVLLLGNLTNPVSKVLMADVSRLYSRKKLNAIGTLLWRTIEFNLSFLLPLVVVCFFEAENILTWAYSEPYRQAADGFRLAVFLLPARALTFSSIQVSTGNSKVVPIIFGINMILTIFVTVMLFQRFSYLSVIIANLAVTYIFSVPAHLFVFSLLKLPMRGTFEARRFIKVIMFAVSPALLFWSGAWSRSTASILYVAVVAILFLRVPGRSPWKMAFKSLHYRKI